MRIILLLVIFVLALSACSDQPAGYSEVQPGVYHKVLGFGEGSTNLRNGFVASLAVYSGQANKLLDYMTITDIDPSEISWDETEFLEHLGNSLHAGDSIAYLLPYSEIRGSFLDEFQSDALTLADTARVQLQIVVRRLYSEPEYYESPEYLSLQQAIRERELIQKILREEGLNDEVQEFSAGWYRILREGKGDTANPGEPIALKLTGSFLNGEVFDVASDSTEYLYFDYGKPDQVIRGIQQSIGYMREGEARELWLPSDMAFGTKGSKGIVPPNEPVRFVVEMVSIGADTLSANSDF